MAIITNLIVHLLACFAGTDADGRPYVWNSGDEVAMDAAQAHRFEDAGFGKIVGEEAPQVADATDDQVETFELPEISAGAKKLITEKKLTDAQIAAMVPTGANGNLIKADVETYLENTKE